MKSVTSIGKRFLVAVSIAFIAPLALQSANAAPLIANNSFETGNSGVAGYTAPFGGVTVPSWTFGPSANPSYDGLSTEGALQLAGTPDGIESAFVEGTGIFSQSISGFATGPYAVTFYTEFRSIIGPEPLQVLIDGTPLTFNSGANSTYTPVTSTSFTFTTTDAFTVSAGTHVLTFRGTIPFSTADHFDYIDFINITSVPEPATLGLLATGALPLVRRRRN
jgi:hypothetical protein